MREVKDLHNHGISILSIKDLCLEMRDAVLALIKPVVLQPPCRGPVVEATLGRSIESLHFHYIHWVDIKITMGT